MQSTGRLLNVTSSLTWERVVKRYAHAARLYTVRRTSFSVVAHGDILRVTPDSTGKPRPITRGDDESTIRLVGKAPRNVLRDISGNASYIIAIVADLETSSA